MKLTFSTHSPDLSVWLGTNRSYGVAAGTTLVFYNQVICEDVGYCISTPRPLPLIEQASTVGLLVKSTQELNVEQTDLRQQVKVLQEQVRRLEALVQQLLQPKP